MLELITLAAANYGIMGNLKKYAGNVTWSGLIIVFAMLVLLVLIIKVFGLIMGGTAKKAKSESVATVQSSVVTSPAVNSVVQGDDGVVAAISAAVAMMYEGTDKTPVIRSIRPAAVGARSIWKQAGILNNTRSF